MGQINPKVNFDPSIRHSSVQRNPHCDRRPAQRAYPRALYARGGVIRICVHYIRVYVCLCANASVMCTLVRACI